MSTSPEKPTSLYAQKVKEMTDEKLKAKAAAKESPATEELYSPTKPNSPWSDTDAPVTKKSESHETTSDANKVESHNDYKYKLNESFPSTAQIEEMFMECSLEHLKTYQKHLNSLLPLLHTAIAKKSLESSATSEPDWKMARTTDGRQFYYNRKTRQRQWSPPTALQGSFDPNGDVYVKRSSRRSHRSRSARRHHSLSKRRDENE